MENHGTFRGCPGLWWLSCSTLPSFALGIVRLHSSSWCWVFSLGSSPAFTLPSPQMILATSGLELMGLTVLGFAPSSLFYLCPLGVLLWPGPRIRAPPSVRLPGHFSPGQKHVMCYRNKDALACWVPRSALGGVHHYPHSIHLIPAITALSDTPQNLHSTDLHLLCLSKSLSTATGLPLSDFQSELQFLPLNTFRTSGTALRVSHRLLPSA